MSIFINADVYGDHSKNVSWKIGNAYLDPFGRVYHKKLFGYVAEDPVAISRGKRYKLFINQTKIEQDIVFTVDNEEVAYTVPVS